MTHDEIDKLEAGPETDALVAEAMGWKLETSKEYPTMRHWMPSGYGEGEWVPSTYIPFAWRVVEKLRGSYLVVIRQCAKSYWCDLGINEAEEWQAEAPTAPLAICRAFLKAGLE